MATMIKPAAIKKYEGSQLDVPSYPTVAHFLLFNARSTSADQNSVGKKLFYNKTTSLSTNDVVHKSVVLARKWRRSGWVKEGDVVALFTANSVSGLFK